MHTHRLFSLAPPLALSLSVATLLAGCGGSDSFSVAVDPSADSCSVLSSSGSAVVVGSGVAGDPSAPEASSGYRLGYKAKYASKYMVVANTPLAS